MVDGHTTTDERRVERSDCKYVRGLLNLGVACTLGTESMSHEGMNMNRADECN